MTQKNKENLQVFKEAHIGKPITKVRRVCELADKGKAVYHSRWARPCPAAFLQNMQTRIIVNFIRMGWLYEYHPLKITKNNEHKKSKSSKANAKNKR